MKTSSLQQISLLTVFCLNRTTQVHEINWNTCQFDDVDTLTCPYQGKGEYRSDVVLEGVRTIEVERCYHCSFRVDKALAPNLERFIQLEGTGSCDLMKFHRTVTITIVNHLCDRQVNIHELMMHNCVPLPKKKKPKKNQKKKKKKKKNKQKKTTKNKTKQNKHTHTHKKKTNNNNNKKKKQQQQKTKQNKTTTSIKVLPHLKELHYVCVQ